MEQAARRAVILESAKVLFAQNGVKGTTMGDIAAKAGLAKPVLYHFYASKDEILEEVIRMEIETLKKNINQGLDELDSPLQRMSKSWENAIEFYEKDDFLMHIMRGNELGLPPYLHERYVMEIESFVVELLQSMIQASIDQGIFVECDSRIAAYIGYKIYQAGTYAKTETLKDFTPKQIMTKTMRIMGFGILNQRPPQDKT
jgi:AcrR family transcriptional regulator